MDNSEHQKDCICAWCEVDRQNAEIRAAKEKADDRLALTACSRSLDVFESWEQFCRVKITGYTLRDGTDVCRFNFPSGKPNARTTDHMTLLINQGWQITAIHYENANVDARRDKTPNPSDG